MNLHLFLIFLVGIAGIFSIAAYSQTPTSTPINILSDSDVFVFVQTVVENPDGQLVTYLTSDKFTDLDYTALDTLIQVEQSEDDPIIIIDDQKFQVIQRLVRNTHDRESVIASTIIVHEQNNIITPVARFAHDGYPTSEGDIVTSAWTFIVPVD